MDSLHAYDSSSSASDENDMGVDSHQKDKKSKRKPPALVGCKEKMARRPECKRARMLNSAKREESKSVSFNDQLSRRTPENDHHEISTNSTIAHSKDQFGFQDSNSSCFRSRLYSSNDNKVSETRSTKILTQPNSNSVGRGTKPYIPKRERLTGINTDATKTNIQSEMRDQVDSELEFQDLDSKRTIDRSKQQNIKSTCRPPKQLHLSFQGHSQGVNCVRWNPSRSNLLLSASMDHIVCIWDTRGSGSCVRRFTCHTEAVKDAKWSQCGTQVLSCGYDKTARLSDLQTGQEIQKFPYRNYVTCVEFHPTNPSLFLAGTFKSTILCWDTRTGNIELSYSACFGQVQDLEFIPGEEEFISAAEVIRRNSTDKGIMVWDFRSTAVLSNQIYQEVFTCTCLRVHPHESHFVAQSNGDYIALFSTKKPYKLNKFKRYEGHKVSGYHIGCDFSPDGLIVSSGSADGSMFFYNHYTSQVIGTHQAHGSPCMDVTYHPSLSSCVASCGWDGHVKVWI